MVLNCKALTRKFLNRMLVELFADAGDAWDTIHGFLRVLSAKKSGLARKHSSVRALAFGQSRYWSGCVNAHSKRRVRRLETGRDMDTALELTAATVVDVQSEANFGSRS